MSEILKESKNKQLYSADEPYSGVKTPDVKTICKFDLNSRFCFLVIGISSFFRYF